MAYEIQNTRSLGMLELPLYFPLTTHVTGRHFLFHKRFILKPADGIPLLLRFRIGQFLSPASLKPSFAPSVYNPASSVTSMYPFRTHVFLASFYAQYKHKVIPPLSTAEYRRSRGLAPLAFNLGTKWIWVDSSFTHWIGCCIWLYMYAVIP
jgi:hypothetical protein